MYALWIALHKVNEQLFFFFFFFLLAPGRGGGGISADIPSAPSMQARNIEGKYIKMMNHVPVKLSKTKFLLNLLTIIYAGIKIKTFLSHSG